MAVHKKVNNSQQDIHNTIFSIITNSATKLPSGYEDVTLLISGRDFSECVDDIVEQLFDKYYIVPKEEDTPIDDTLWIGVTSKGEVTGEYSNKWL